MFNSSQILIDIETAVGATGEITFNCAEGIHPACSLLEWAVTQFISVLVNTNQCGGHQPAFDIIRTQPWLVLQQQCNNAAHYRRCLGGTRHGEILSVVIEIRIFIWQVTSIRHVSVQMPTGRHDLRFHESFDGRPCR